MKAIFRHNQNVTDSVTLSVTFYCFPMVANSVTPRLRQSQHQRESNRHEHPQGLKALHFGNLPNYVTPSGTLNVTRETPIGTGVKGIVLHLLHLLSYKINKVISNI